MRFTRAIVRRPGRTFAGGLTSAPLGAPDVDKAVDQHARYCDALRANGLEITELEPEDRYPDSTFVEDTAVIAGGRAILTRPGAPSRLGEAAAMRPVLARFFNAIDEIAEPGTVDGGDVCEAGERVFIGISQRTNEVGARQLAAFLSKAGKTPALVDIRDMRTILHLKSGIAYVGGGDFVAIEELLPRLDLDPRHAITVSAGEAYGANCVRVNDVVLVAAGHPNLEDALARRRYATLALDMSEYRKMDGGLSCLSLRF